MEALLVRFRSSLSEDELWETVEERKPSFREVPGLVQKFYLVPRDGEGIGGLYVFDSPESLGAFRETELARSIPDAYAVEGEPDVDRFGVHSTLLERT